MEKAYVLIGHGAGEEALVLYEKLLEMAKNKYEETYLVMLHGNPSVESVAKAVNEKGIKKVILIPLLLATGHHMEKNIISPESEIHNAFLKCGIQVEVVKKGLLDYEEIRNVIIGCIM